MAVVEISFQAENRYHLHDEQTMCRKLFLMFWIWIVFKDTTSISIIKTKYFKSMIINEIVHLEYDWI